MLLCTELPLQLDPHSHDSGNETCFWRGHCLSTSLQHIALSTMEFDSTEQAFCLTVDWSCLCAVPGSSSTCYDCVQISIRQISIRQTLIRHYPTTTLQCPTIHGHRVICGSRVTGCLLCLLISGFKPQVAAFKHVQRALTVLLFSTCLTPMMAREVPAGELLLLREQESQGLATIALFCCVLLAATWATPPAPQKTILQL